MYNSHEYAAVAGRPAAASVGCNDVRSVTLNLAKTLNLANKFSQCTFSTAEHYDLLSSLIK